MPCYSRRQPNRGEGGNREYGRLDRSHGSGQGPLTVGCSRQSRGSLTGVNLQGAGRAGEEGEVVRGKKGGLGGKGRG